MCISWRIAWGPKLWLELCSKQLGRSYWQLLTWTGQVWKRGHNVWTLLSFLATLCPSNMLALTHLTGFLRAAGRLVLPVLVFDCCASAGGNQQITVYWNTFDLVLFISMVKNKSPRVGQTPNWQQKSNVAYVDCSGISTTLHLIHSYVLFPSQILIGTQF